MSTSHVEFYRGLETASRILAMDAADPAAAAAAVHAGVAGLLRDTEANTSLACRAGCAHCCHLPVGVSFGEALLLVRAVRDDEALAARVAADAAATASVPWDALVGRACPLLVDGRCARHAARPLPCRALGSRDAAACERVLADGPPPPRDEAAWWRGLGVSRALAGALGTRELRAAVAALLGSPADPARAFVAARSVG